MKKSRKLEINVKFYLDGERWKEVSGLMISQAVIIENGKLLMVKQYVQRGDIVWNFPGGGIDENETPEEACVREVREETGYDVTLRSLLFKSVYKHTFFAEICGGSLLLDQTNPDNSDIIDVKWISLDEVEKFDSYTKPILKLLSENNLK